MKKKARLLFISTCRSPFVQTDINILSEFFSLTVLIGSGLSMILKIMFLLPFYPVIFCWFGTVYSAWAVIGARIWRKKIFIVLGGVDAVKIPELQYGIWINPWKARLLSIAYRNATGLLAVSPKFKEQIRKLANYSAENVFFLPTGYDTLFWSPSGEKEKTVLTVAHSGFNVSVEDAIRRFKIKGLDRFFESVKGLPEIHFILVGFSEQLLSQMQVEIPENTELIDFLTQDRLLEYYRKTQVYCQPSLSEGLPNTLCEAMSCGCIPVGSDAGGIPEAIGETGEVVPFGDTEKLTAAIRRAIQANPERGMAARKRIEDKFSIAERQKRLSECIGGAVR